MRASCQNWHAFAVARSPRIHDSNYCGPQRFGCVRIAQQISHAFGIEIDKDVVRRVLAQHYGPDDAGSNGSSWLALMAHSKDSLWSVDLFRCESILLHSYWVLVVMDSPAES